MKRINYVWAVLLPALFLFQGCQPAATDSQPAAIDLDAVKAEIETMEKAFADAYNARDAEKVAAYYADDAQSLSDGKPTAVGKSEITALLRAELEADTTGHTVSFTTTGVWAGGNYATETGTSTTKDKDGNVVRSGKYMTLFELRDGKYIAIRDIYNGDQKEGM